MTDEGKCPHQELEDKFFEAVQETSLSWREEIEALFNTAGVAYYVLEEKCLSERELSSYLDYQKERLLALLVDERRIVKRKDFGDKKELK